MVVDQRDRLIRVYRAAIQAFRVLVDDQTLDAIQSHGGLEAQAVKGVKAALTVISEIEAEIEALTHA